MPGIKGDEGGPRGGRLFSLVVSAQRVVVPTQSVVRTRRAGARRRGDSQCGQEGGREKTYVLHVLYPVNMW
jgi:hypothetical protein